MSARPPSKRRSAAAEAERGVLMSLLVEPSHWDKAEGLEPRHFGDPRYRRIFDAMRGLRADGKPVDGVLLRERLGITTAELNDALVDICKSDGVHWHCASYVAEILESYERRRLAESHIALGQMLDSGLPLEDVRGFLEKIAESVGRYAPSDPAVKDAGREVIYQRLTAAELDAGEYTTEFLIEGTLVAGQPLVVAGGKKCLKTNILLDAAISLATATPMLGTLTVNRGCRVAVMSGESGLATIQETCRRICRAKGIELRDVPGLIFSPDLPRIDDARHQVALAEFLTADEIELVVLDPAYLCLPSDDNGNLFAQGNILRTLNEVCSEVGASLALCHHTKRTGVDPFQPPELEHIAWAGFQEFARQWWLLGRRERFDPDSDGEHRLWLNVGGSAGFASLWAVDVTEGKYPAPRRWEVTLNHAAEAREQAVEQQQAERAEQKAKRHLAAVEAAKERIADALRSVPGNCDTKRNIRERCGMKGAAFDEAFGALLRCGKLTAVAIGRGNGRTYEGFRYEFDQRS